MSNITFYRFQALGKAEVSFRNIISQRNIAKLKSYKTLISAEVESLPFRNIISQRNIAKLKSNKTFISAEVESLPFRNNISKRNIANSLDLNQKNSGAACRYLLSYAMGRTSAHRFSSSWSSLLFKKGNAREFVLHQQNEFCFATGKSLPDVLHRSTRWINKQYYLKWNYKQSLMRNYSVGSHFAYHHNSSSYAIKKAFFAIKCHQNSFYKKQWKNHLSLPIVCISSYALFLKKKQKQHLETMFLVYAKQWDENFSRHEDWKKMPSFAGTQPIILYNDRQQVKFSEISLLLKHWAKPINLPIMSFAQRMGEFSNLKQTDGQSSTEKFFGRSFDKGRLKKFVRWFVNKWGLKKAIKLLESLKFLGFKYAKASGISLSLEDLYIPSNKESLVKIHQLQLLEQEFKVFQKTSEQTTYSAKFISTWTIINQLLRNAFLQYFMLRSGPAYRFPTNEAMGWNPTAIHSLPKTIYSLQNKLLFSNINRIYVSSADPFKLRLPFEMLSSSSASPEVSSIMENDEKKKALFSRQKFGSDSLYIMAFSGARGNMSQVSQLTLMRGLMSDPLGKLVEFPILSNFREGLNLTEYLISCYGARKGIIDTGLRTATAGDFTRRLVDVAHTVIIQSFDCGTNNGIYLKELTLSKNKKTLFSFEQRLYGRIIANNSRIAKNYRNKEITNDLLISLKTHNKSKTPSVVPIQSKNSWLQNGHKSDRLGFPPSHSLGISPCFAWKKPKRQKIHFHKTKRNLMGFTQNIKKISTYGYRFKVSLSFCNKQNNNNRVVPFSIISHNISFIVKKSKKKQKRRFGGFPIAALEKNRQTVPKTKFFQIFSSAIKLNNKQNDYKQVKCNENSIYRFSPNIAGMFHNAYTNSSPLALKESLRKPMSWDSNEICVRSPLTCETLPTEYLCRKCYGWNAIGRIIDIGEAVGILAAQSLGEPGTQLTLRTFHTGGIYSETAGDFKLVAPFDGNIIIPNYCTVKRYFNSKEKISTLVAWKKSYSKKKTKTLPIVSQQTKQWKDSQGLFKKPYLFLYCHPYAYSLAGSASKLRHCMSVSSRQGIRKSPSLKEAMKWNPINQSLPLLVDLVYRPSFQITPLISLVSKTLASAGEFFTSEAIKKSENSGQRRIRFAYTKRIHERSLLWKKRNLRRSLSVPSRKYPQEDISVYDSLLQSNNEFPKLRDGGNPSSSDSLPLCSHEFSTGCSTSSFTDRFQKNTAMTNFSGNKFIAAKHMFVFLKKKKQTSRAFSSSHSLRKQIKLYSKHGANHQQFVKTKSFFLYVNKNYDYKNLTTLHLKNLLQCYSQEKYYQTFKNATLYNTSLFYTANPIISAGSFGRSPSVESLPREFKDSSMRWAKPIDWSRLSKNQTEILLPQNSNKSDRLVKLFPSVIGYFKSPIAMKWNDKNVNIWGRYSTDELRFPFFHKREHSRMRSASDAERILLCPKQIMSFRFLIILANSPTFSDSFRKLKTLSINSHFSPQWKKYFSNHSKDLANSLCLNKENLALDKPMSFTQEKPKAWSGNNILHSTPALRINWNNRQRLTPSELIKFNPFQAKQWSTKKLRRSISIFLREKKIPNFIISLSVKASLAVTQAEFNSQYKHQLKPEIETYTIKGNEKSWPIQFYDVRDFSACRYRSSCTIKETSLFAIKRHPRLIENINKIKKNFYLSLNYWKNKNFLKPLIISKTPSIQNSFISLEIINMKSFDVSSIKEKNEKKHPKFWVSNSAYKSTSLNLPYCQENWQTTGSALPIKYNSLTYQTKSKEPISLYYSSFNDNNKKIMHGWNKHFFSQYNDNNTNILKNNYNSYLRKSMIISHSNMCQSLKISTLWLFIKYIKPIIKDFPAAKVSKNDGLRRNPIMDEISLKKVWQIPLINSNLPNIRFGFQALFSSYSSSGQNFYNRKIPADWFSPNEAIKESSNSINFWAEEDNFSIVKNNENQSAKNLLSQRKMETHGLYESPESYIYNNNNNKNIIEAYKIGFSLEALFLFSHYFSSNFYGFSSQLYMSNLRILNFKNTPDNFQSHGLGTNIKMHLEKIAFQSSGKLPPDALYRPKNNIQSNDIQKTMNIKNAFMLQMRKASPGRNRQPMHGQSPQDFKQLFLTPSVVSFDAKQQDTTQIDQYSENKIKEESKFISPNFIETFAYGNNSHSQNYQTTLTLMAEGQFKKNRIIVEIKKKQNYYIYKKKDHFLFTVPISLQKGLFSQIIPYVLPPSFFNNKLKQTPLKNIPYNAKALGKFHQFSESFTTGKSLPVDFCQSKASENSLSQRICLFFIKNKNKRRERSFLLKSKGNLRRSLLVESKKFPQEDIFVYNSLLFSNNEFPKLYDGRNPSSKQSDKLCLMHGEIPKLSANRWASLKNSTLKKIYFKRTNKSKIASVNNLPVAMKDGNQWAKPVNFMRAGVPPIAQVAPEVPFYEKKGTLANSFCISKTNYALWRGNSQLLIFFMRKMGEFPPFSCMFHCCKATMKSPSYAIERISFLPKHQKFANPLGSYVSQKNFALANRKVLSYGFKMKCHKIIKWNYLFLMSFIGIIRGKQNNQLFLNSPLSKTKQWNKKKNKTLDKDRQIHDRLETMSFSTVGSFHAKHEINPQKKIFYKKTLPMFSYYTIAALPLLKWKYKLTQFSFLGQVIKYKRKAKPVGLLRAGFSPIAQLGKFIVEKQQRNLHRNFLKRKFPAENQQSEIFSPQSIICFADAKQIRERSLLLKKGNLRRSLSVSSKLRDGRNSSFWGKDSTDGLCPKPFVLLKKTNLRAFPFIKKKGTSGAACRFFPNSSMKGTLARGKAMSLAQNILWYSFISAGSMFRFYNSNQSFIFSDRQALAKTYQIHGRKAAMNSLPIGFRKTQRWENPQKINSLPQISHESNKLGKPQLCSKQWDDTQIHFIPTKLKKPKTWFKKEEKKQTVKTINKNYYASLQSSFGTLSYIYVHQTYKTKIITHKLQKNSDAACRFLPSYAMGVNSNSRLRLSFSFKDSPMFCMKKTDAKMNSSSQSNHQFDGLCQMHGEIFKRNHELPLKIKHPSKKIKSWPTKKNFIIHHIYHFPLYKPMLWKFYSTQKRLSPFIAKKDESSIASRKKKKQTSQAFSFIKNKRESQAQPVDFLQEISSKGNFLKGKDSTNSRRFARRLKRNLNLPFSYNCSRLSLPQNFQEIDGLSPKKIIQSRIIPSFYSQWNNKYNSKQALLSIYFNNLYNNNQLLNRQGKEYNSRLCNYKRLLIIQKFKNRWAFPKVLVKPMGFAAGKSLKIRFMLYNKQNLKKRSLDRLSLKTIKSQNKQSVNGNFLKINKLFIKPWRKNQLNRFQVGNFPMRCLRQNEFASVPFTFRVKGRDSTSAQRVGILPMGFAQCFTPFLNNKNTKTQTTFINSSIGQSPSYLLPLYGEKIPDYRFPPGNFLKRTFPCMFLCCFIQKKSPSYAMGGIPAIQKKDIVSYQLTVGLLQSSISLSQNIIRFADAERIRERFFLLKQGNPNSRETDGLYLKYKKNTQNINNNNTLPVFSFQTSSNVFHHPSRWIKRQDQTKRWNGTDQQNVRTIVNCTFIFGQFFKAADTIHLMTNNNIYKRNIAKLKSYKTLISGAACRYPPSYAMGFAQKIPLSFDLMISKHKGVAWKHYKSSHYSKQSLKKQRRSLETYFGYDFNQSIETYIPKTGFAFHLFSVPNNLINHGRGIYRRKAIMNPTGFAHNLIFLKNINVGISLDRNYSLLLRYLFEIKRTLPNETLRWDLNNKFKNEIIPSSSLIPLRCLISEFYLEPLWLNNIINSRINVNNNNVFDNKFFYNNQGFFCSKAKFVLPKAFPGGRIPTLQAMHGEIPKENEFASVPFTLKVKGTSSEGTPAFEKPMGFAQTLLKQYYDDIYRYNYSWHFINLSFDIIIAKNVNHFRNARYNYNENITNKGVRHCLSVSLRQRMGESPTWKYNVKNRANTFSHINLQSKNLSAFQINIFNNIYFLYEVASLANSSKSSDITQGVPLLKRYFDLPKESPIHLLLKQTFQKYYSYGTNEASFLNNFNTNHVPNNQEFHESFATEKSLTVGKIPTLQEISSRGYFRVGFFVAKQQRIPQAMHREISNLKTKTIFLNHSSQWNKIIMTPKTKFGFHSIASFSKNKPVPPIAHIGDFFHAMYEKNIHENVLLKKFPKGNRAFSKPMSFAQRMGESLSSRGRDYTDRFSPKNATHFKIRTVALKYSLIRVLQKIVNNVQAVYRGQGVDIYDQHIEVLVSQMGFHVIKIIMAPFKRVF